MMFIIAILLYFAAINFGTKVNKSFANILGMAITMILATGILLA